MRKEAVYAVILNVPLFEGMKCSVAADPRFIRFSVIEEGKTTHYNLRVRLFSFLLFFSFPSSRPRIMLTTSPSFRLVPLALLSLHKLTVLTDSPFLSLRRCCRCRRHRWLAPKQHPTSSKRSTPTYPAGVTRPRSRLRNIQPHEACQAC